MVWVIKDRFLSYAHIRSEDLISDATQFFIIAHMNRNIASSSSDIANMALKVASNGQNVAHNLYIAHMNRNIVSSSSDIANMALKVASNGQNVAHNLYIAHMNRNIVSSSSNIANMILNVASNIFLKDTIYFLYPH